MNPARLGTSDLFVSPIVLGCMTYGVADRGPHPRPLPEDPSRPYLEEPCTPREPGF